MKKLLIAGSSGMVGRIVLQEALISPDIKTVVSLVRRPSGISHPKLQEVIHQDFSNLKGQEGVFSDVDSAFFCIGEYTGVVPDNLFKKITVDMAVSFGDMLQTMSPNARLCFLSGAGADRSEKSRMSFARYKGMAENHLLSLNLAGLHIFRPGYIYPIEKREEPNFSYRVFRALYPLLGRFVSHVTSEQLGRSMFKVGIEGHDLDTLENKDINDVLL